MDEVAKAASTRLWKSKRPRRFVTKQRREASAERAPWKRTGFRVAGVVVLVVSLGLPAAGVLFEPQSEWLVPVLSYVVALASGFSVFFQWQKAWQGYMQARLGLELCWWEWEAARAEALAEEDPAKALAIAKSAVRDLISKASDFINQETGEYFRATQQPTTSRDDSGRPKTGL